MKQCEINVDVAIIGAGVAGLALALFLAPLQRSVAIIDAKDKIIQTPRTIALSLSSVELLKSLHVWDKIKTQVNPIDSVEVSQMKAFGLSYINKNKYDVDALGYVVNLSFLEKIMTEALHAFEHVKFYGSSVLQSMTFDENSSSYALEIDCKNIPTSGNQFLINTQFLVGADGIHSKVRTQLGLAIESYEYRHVAIGCNITLRHPHENCAFERYVDNGVLAFLPYLGKQGTIVASLESPQADIFVQDDNAFRNWLDECLGERLGFIEKIEPRVKHPLVQHFAPIQVSQQAMLVGNAAHIFHPIAAQGFNLTLRDLQRFTGLYKQTLDGSLTMDEALITYDRERHDQNQIRQFTDILAKLGENEWLPKSVMGASIFGFALMPTLLDKSAKIGMGFGSL